MATTESSPFVGEWHLSELVDATTGTLPMPDKVMTVKLQSISDTELSLVMKVGNSMRSKITLAGAGDNSDGEEIKVGPVMSTRMRPPQDLWDVEQFLTKTLETVHKMEINKDDNLVLEGNGGSIICSK
eukprot:scaffold2962_cov126-Cylindrotheca_fusiformis.AAC.3